MSHKVYKRSDASRSIKYQDDLLAPVVPGWPDVPTFFDAEIDAMLRVTRRQAKFEIWTPSLALLADTEAELKARITRINALGLTLRCVEENSIWGPITISRCVKEWKAARKSGSAMRGAQASAAAKKAKTLARFAIISGRWPLPSKEWPAKALLKEAGIRSINTVNNLHSKLTSDGKVVPKTREDFQKEYQIALKRKARRQKAKAA